MGGAHAVDTHRMATRPCSPYASPAATNSVPLPQPSSQQLPFGMRQGVGPQEGAEASVGPPFKDEASGAILLQPEGHKEAASSNNIFPGSIRHHSTVYNTMCTCNEKGLPGGRSGTRVCSHPPARRGPVPIVPPPCIIIIMQVQSVHVCGAASVKGGWHCTGSGEDHPRKPPYESRRASYTRKGRPHITHPAPHPPILGLAVGLCTPGEEEEQGGCDGASPQQGTAPLLVVHQKSSTAFTVHDN